MLQSYTPRYVSGLFPDHLIHGCHVFFILTAYKIVLAFVEVLRNTIQLKDAILLQFVYSWRVTIADDLQLHISVKCFTIFLPYYRSAIVNSYFIQMAQVLISLTIYFIATFYS